MRSKRAPALAAVAAVALLAGYGGISSSFAAGGSNRAVAHAAKGGYVIGFVNPSQAQPALDQWQEAAVLEAKHLGDKVITASAGFDPNVEVEATEAMISRHVNAIITAPLDPALLDPVYAKAKAAGIKVLLWQATSPSARNMLVYNTESAAENDIETMAAQVKKQGKKCNALIMQGLPTVPSIKAYDAGELIGAKSAGCTVLDKEVDTADSIDGAAAIANTWRTRFGTQATVIACYNDTCPLGVIPAFGSTFDPIVNGTGGGSQNIQLLDEHKEAEESVQDNNSAGQAQAWLANQILSGKSVPTTVTGSYQYLVAGKGSAWAAGQAALLKKAATSIKITTVDGKPGVLVDGSSA